jgi:AraC family transcriptional regulator, positive regulator of tynA and feaB
VPGARNLVGRLMRPDSGASRMLLGLLRILGNEIGPSGCAGLSPAFGESVLSFIAATYSSHLGTAGSRGAEARALAFRAYIDSRLTDPDLSPAEVASHAGVSERYLRAVLASQGESFSSYVLRRRLQRCALLLRDSGWSRHTITQIAFQSGFSNVTHFGQAFKKCYGLTPRDYRAAAPGHRFA